MRGRYTMLGILVLLVSSCTMMPKTDAPQSPALSLARMQQAGADFASARDAGDALEMARAAAARKPFDVLAGDTNILTSTTMFEEARQLAASNEELLAKIAELESGRSGPFSNLSGLTGLSLSRLFAERNVPLMVVDGEGALRELQSAKPPVAPNDCGSQNFGPSPNRVLKVGAKSSVLLCGAVRAKKTLIVYVEGGFDARLVLRIFDIETMQQNCEHVQPRVNPVCDWRPTKATRAIVEISNPGDSEVSVTLFANHEL